MTCPPDQVYTGPKRDWVMAYARNWRMVRHQAYGAAATTLVFKPGRIVRTRRFTYVNERLAEATR